MVLCLNCILLICLKIEDFYKSEISCWLVEDKKGKVIVCSMALVCIPILSI